ncbi:MAG: sulfate adenylyltransferase [bacterium]|nr:sulfate adenylyltransferase [bacterium]
MIKPHGGKLVNRILSAAAQESARERAKDLPKIAVSQDTLTDLENIADGIFSPLEGFMNQKDFQSVVDNMRLSNGLPWTIPIILDVEKEVADRLRLDSEVALIDPSGDVAAILYLEDKYSYDKEHLARQVFKTTEDKHPGVKKVYSMGEVLLGGKIDLLKKQPDPYARYNLSPRETRLLFQEKGWETIVAFQTRNPVHRAHEYLQKCALEVVDGLLLHPLVGETKSDDIPTDIRIKCYEVIVKQYYHPQRTIFSVMPVNMRYAGPREAIFHAILRKNYGCTHFIVGRDHAGVGNYYGTYDAHYIFREFSPQELEITPFFFEHAFYCKRCGGMASSKTCPHDSSDHVVLSGTKVREMLSRGEIPPKEFTRQEVAEILIAGLRQQQQQR